VDVIPRIDVDVVAVPQRKGQGKAGEYSGQPRVLFAEQDFQIQAVEDPNDSYFKDWQWGLKKVQAPAAWDVTQGDPSVLIAVLDSGVDLSHPDLAAKLVASANFTSSPDVTDVCGHGTHVAGIAAADTNNSVGVAGLGYRSTILNVKVLADFCSGSYSWAAQGIVWAVDRGARVINMSFGSPSPSSTIEEAISYAWGKGAVVVAAAGNSGSTGPFYPAYYPSVIAVASTDPTDQLAPYSNRGDWVDVAAPGDSIWSTKMNKSYGYMSGTSMAAPHVAGLAALVFTRVSDTNGNGLLNDEVRACIQDNADDIGVTGIGSGRINAYRAVNCALPPPPTTGTISGTAVDASGAAIAGATVSDGIRLAVTDSTGAYSLSVPEGTNAFTASAAGYQSASQTVSVTAGLTTTANFALNQSIVMWVLGIKFVQIGSNLRVDVTVTSDLGPVAGASVSIQVTRNNKQWNLQGTTNASGVTTFTIRNAPSGGYSAKVTKLTASGYVWDPTRGGTTSTYTLGSR